MTVSALWAVLAEPPVKPWTIFHPRVRVNVKVLTLLVRAFPVLGEEVALWHFSHVILMQVLTTVTLFTETP